MNPPGGLSYSVIIATLRRPELLSQAIDSVLRAAGNHLVELIVVDGDLDRRSAEGVVTSRSGGSTPVRYLSTAASSTAQRNRGIDVARGDIAVFIDDDSMVPPEVFDVLEEVYRDEETVGVTGRVLHPTDRRIVGVGSPLFRLLPGGGREGEFTRYGFPRRLVRTDAPRDVQFMPGAFFTARLPLVRELRFDEALTGYALAEDEDLSYRLSRLGRIRYLPQLVIRHAKLGFGTRDRREFNRKVVVNRHYLFRKNFRQTPLARVQFWLLIVGFFIHRLANRDWTGLRGLAEGVVHLARDR